MTIVTVGPVVECPVITSLDLVKVCTYNLAIYKL